MWAFETAHEISKHPWPGREKMNLWNILDLLSAYYLCKSTSHSRKPCDKKTLVSQLGSFPNLGTGCTGNTTNNWEQDCTATPMPMFSLLCHHAKPDFPVLANAMWYRSRMTLPDLTLQPTPGEQNKNLILEVGVYLSQVTQFQQISAHRNWVTQLESVTYEVVSVCIYIHKSYSSI